MVLAIPVRAKAPTNEYQNTQTINDVLPSASSSEPSVIQPNAVRVETPKPAAKTEAGVYSGRNYTKEEVIQLIKDYSLLYGIPDSLPLAIAKCESGYNQFSKNSHSTASGVFQYLHSTWMGTEEGKQGFDVFDADANVRAAVRNISKSTSPWDASKSCWAGTQ